MYVRACVYVVRIVCVCLCALVVVDVNVVVKLKRTELAVQDIC